MLGFWSIHPHHIEKIAQSFINSVCPIHQWNGQQPPTNNSDCWTQFSICVPAFYRWWNRSSSNNCLLLSTQNNNPTPDTRTSQSKILPSDSYGIGTVIQQFDSAFWQRWTVGWMFCRQLCSPGGTLSAAATCSVWWALLLVALVPVTLLNSLLGERYIFLCIWGQKNNRTMHGLRWNVYVIHIL